MSTSLSYERDGLDVAGEEGSIPTGPNGSLGDLKRRISS